MPDRHLPPTGPSEASPAEPMPCAIRDTVLSMVSDPCDRMALALLGRMVFASALQSPAPPDADRSLRPTLRAAANDLLFVAETLATLSPLGSPCDVTLAAVADQVSGTLHQVSESLVQTVTTVVREES